MRFFGDSAEFGTFFPRIPRLACKTALPTHFKARLFFASAYRDAPSCSQNTTTSAAPHACGHCAQYPLRQQTTKNPPCESTCGYCDALQALKLLNWCAGGDPKNGLNPHKITTALRNLQKIPAKIPTLFKVPYICFNPVDVLSYPPIADIQDWRARLIRSTTGLQRLLLVAAGGQPYATRLQVDPKRWIGVTAHSCPGVELGVNAFNCDVESSAQ